MKVNEIMMGDYFDIVSVRGNEKLHFTNGRITAIENDRFVRVNGIRFHVNSLKGTKLTKDFFIANEFVADGAEHFTYVLRRNGFVIWAYLLLNVVIIDIDHNYTDVKGDGLFDDKAHKCCNYVHEFQHALRTCRLSEVADYLIVKGVGK